MRRFHLFEFNDRAWLPASIRDAATDYLQHSGRVMGVYGPAVVDRLRGALERAGTRRVVDLCSGGGGPWLDLYGKLGDVEVRPTDPLPNVAGFEAARAATGGRVAFHPEPVDATAVPASLDGFRTMFTGFHHFRPDQARAILADAVAKGHGVAIFEATERKPLAAAAMLILPLVVLLVTPFIRPFRWSRLFWTYLVPAVPFIVFFDGIVSCLRTYTTEELLAMAREVGGDYEWQTGREPIGRGGPIGVTYLVGLPQARSGSDLRQSASPAPPAGCSIPPEISVNFPPDHPVKGFLPRVVHVARARIRKEGTLMKATRIRN